MSYYLSLLSKISPFLIFILLEYFIYSYKNFYYILIVIMLLIFFSVKNIKIREDLNIKWYLFLIYPVLLQISFISYLLMEPDDANLHYLLLINTIIIYFYFRTLRLYFSGIDKGVSLNNITIFGNFVLVYFLASSIYGLQSSLRVSVWLLMAIFVLFLSSLVYFVMYINKIKASIAIFYVLIVTLIMLELAWSIYFLPVTYKISGLILAIGYYMIMGLSRHHLADTLKRHTVKLYLSFGFISIVLILLTAPWK